MRTKFKILIVEDEILIADNIKKHLNKKGYEVVGIAISFEEAVALFHREKPDLILLDIRLSGEKTGIDFAKYLAENKSETAFIYLTSQLDEQNIRLAKETFPAAYLSKPIQKSSLYANIEIVKHKQQTILEKEKSIALFDGHRNYIIPVNKIQYLEADHIYVNVFIDEGKRISQRSSFKDLLGQLPSDLFIQTHRSFAVNIKQVSHWDNQFVYILEEAIPISRSRRKVIDVLQELTS